MIQFLNNICSALCSENIKLVNFILCPVTIIENYLFMEIFLNVFNVKASRNKKLLYVSSITLISIFNMNFVPSPFNVIINYTFFVVLTHIIFKFNLIQSLTALVIPSFIFAVLNILLQKPFMLMLNIGPNEFMATPIYRLSYLSILYLIVFIIIRAFKNFKFDLEIFNKLDKKTLIILCFNILTGFLVLCIHLITSAFYIDIVPIIINILNFLLLLLFFSLNIYSITRIIKLASTRKDLECAEEYNKSLEILYDKVKGFKHDFDNIVSTLDGYIENNDIHGLKDYFKEVKKDCKITNNLTILNPRIINNPGIYSLLNNKYFKANNLGINFEIEYFINLSSVKINLYELSRILGILIDNAIEEAQKCEDKTIKLSFLYENRNHRAVISIENTYSNKDVDIEKIFTKGESGKENHSGIGLWEVRNYIKKSKNLDLFTTKNDTFFKQELSIYD